MRIAVGSAATVARPTTRSVTDEEDDDVRVLVVSEDAKERLRAISALRLHVGAEVVELTTVAQARAALLDEDEHFDVLVVDGDLQPRGGFGLLYDVRAHRTLTGQAATPSLLMIAREQDRWLASWAGASEALLKPVDIFELARKVDALEGTEPAPYSDLGAATAQVAAREDT